jgi:hypothetical protein
MKSTVNAPAELAAGDWTSIFYSIVNRVAYAATLSL